MQVVERQELRLNILKTICEKFNYSLNNTFEKCDVIFELFKDINEADIINELSYLREKGYLKFAMIHMDKPMPMNIQLEAKAIDLVEKILTNMPTDQYKQDFSETALANFSNINNSQIIVNSPNAQIYITHEESKELIAYLDSLTKIHSKNEMLQSVVNNTKTEIENGKATKEYLRGIAATLKSVGISLTTNLLTATVSKLLGIIMKNNADSSGRVERALRNLLEDKGYITTGGNAAAYSVTANLTVADEELPAGLFLRPGIVVSIERSGKALFSYSKNYPRYGHKTRDGALSIVSMFPSSFLLRSISFSTGFIFSVRLCREI